LRADISPITEYLAAVPPHLEKFINCWRLDYQAIFLRKAWVVCGASRLFPSHRESVLIDMVFQALQLLPPLMMCNSEVETEVEKYFRYISTF
jgi:hypothetical protein